MTAEIPPLGRVLWRGLKGRCPRCGQAPILEKLLKPRPQCAFCGLRLHAWAGSDGPSYFVMFLVITLVPILALVYELKAMPPLWHHVAAWPILTVALSLGLLRPAKGLFIALEYRYNTDTFEHRDDVHKTNR